MEQEIRAIIAGAVDALVEWGSLPQLKGSQKPYPGVVLNTISDRSGQTFDGPDGMSATRVQVDVYAEGYGQAKTIARQIRVALDGYRGGMILGTFRLSERDSRENGEASKPFRISQDFEVHWRL